MADSIKSPAPFALAMTVSDGDWQNRATGQYTILGRRIVLIDSLA